MLPTSQLKKREIISRFFFSLFILLIVFGKIFVETCIFISCMGQFQLLLLKVLLFKKWMQLLH